MTSLCLARIVWPAEVVEAIRARLEPPEQVALKFPTVNRWSDYLGMA
jgi:hypothetical protein